MCVQWCVLVPGAADPAPADGEADGDGDGDDDDDDADCADAVDVTDGDAAEPLVAAMATLAVPAPRPAARNAVRIRRRARPPLMDVIWFLLPKSAGGPAAGPLWAPGWGTEPPATRGVTLSAV
jgi:hypothetical protein